MEEFKLSAVSRETKPEDDKHYILAELYGPGVENKHLLVEKVEFEKVFAQAGKASLISLSINKQEPVLVIIKDIQRDVLKGHIIHVDFYQVKMDQKITAQVEIISVGKSLAVANLGGILIKNLTKVNIECLPKDLINKIEVDLGKLKNIGDTLRVEDLEVSENVKIKNNPRDVVFSVSASRKAMTADDQSADNKIENTEEDKAEEKKEGEGQK